MADALMYRRTRIVCISDTHNCTVKLPKGDVLIHAGDLTNQGSYSELSKAVKWLEQADFESKIVIAGNHDITLDKDFFAEHGLYFHNQNLQSPEECLSLLTSSPSITYLNHESTTIRLTSPSGPRTQFTVFGSPFSPRHGLWAFNYDSPQNPSSCTDLTTIWDRIPLDTDIVVTHTPPKTHCDETEDRRAAGCEALRRSLWRVRPRLAVCGHVHPGRGAERVAWDLSSRNIAYKESGILRWQDPGEGNNKISLVDLTGRKAPSLANDGSHPGRSHRPSCLEGPATIPSRDTVGSAGPPPFSFSSNDVDAQVCRSNIGLGGDATSLRSDQPALAGRMGRRETCVVNAAIMKKNYPHVGSRQLNKAIVVDLDLPVWED
ncbi:Metallo-dependent phosphatase-like protein [Dactylonectria estremocensis]|uniref:Metallo-dependent phosphatase-like protein n=1 Tax=Dactylonectria estremocensis TaxID=1079267 RepID=A0A9P9EP21_9HYPO|nr:Metallo-dependent phosphatase-like protein [Dactylonectria estremocensis]